MAAARSLSPVVPPGSLHPFTAVAGLAVCVLAVVEVLTSAPEPERGGRAVLVGLVVGVPIAVGVYATWSRQHARFGWMLIAAGAAWSLTALAENRESVVYSIGRVSAWLVFPSLFYLMLAFPMGRVGAPLDRALLLGLDAVLVLLFIGSALFISRYPAQTPWATCSADCPPNAFMLVERQPGVMTALVQPVREWLAVGLLLGVTWSLARRMRGSSPLERRSSGPVLVMSMLSSVILAAYFPVRRAVPDAPAVAALGTAWALCIPAIAGAFFVGLLRRHVTVAAGLQRLSIALRRDLSHRELRGALASALDDPRLDVLLPGGAPGDWRDSDGKPASASSAAVSGRAVTRIDDAGAPLAALVHDRGLEDNRDLLDAVASLVATALRHERLKVSLARSLSQLEDSRHRIAMVADVERARIERDLHDGAQQHLIMLRVKLSLAEDLLRTDPVAGTHALHDLGAEIDSVLDELRSLAHGVYPSLLSDRGLEDALRSVVVGSPIPVELSVRVLRRHNREVETAVYFTALEAFQNALKHAGGATRLWISLRENDALKLEVRDDGDGFVSTALDGPGGLRNMRDRLEAVGGTLVIDSSPGHGTRIRGTVPLLRDTSRSDR
jgi:signal transduction histidine kinase